MSLTFMHPTQEVDASVNISSPLCILVILSDLHAKFYGDRPREPLRRALNARGVANTAILNMSKAISHKRYKVRSRVQLRKWHVRNLLL